jgi:hypothetical protein
MAALWNVNIALYRGVKGRRNMPILVSDLLLFFCLAGWVAGMVIAIASMLS